MRAFQRSILHATIISITCTMGMSTSLAAGALAVGACGAYGQAFGYKSNDARKTTRFSSARSQAAGLLPSCARAVQRSQSMWPIRAGRAVPDRPPSSAMRRTARCGNVTAAAARTVSSAPLSVTARAGADSRPAG
jgi:hypothetical protein